MNYETELKKYFTIKSKYQSEYNKKKHAIIMDDDLSKREKRSKVARIRMKCVGCKRPVGTIFSDENRTYSAVCGDTVAPCPLDISIQKSVTINARMALHEEYNTNNNTMNDIISLKLKLLFGLVSEDDMLMEFDELKKKHSDTSSYINMLETIVDLNKDEREQLIRENEEELATHIETFKELIKEYNKDLSTSTLRDAIELYINDILKTNENINSNKFQHRTVEECFEDEKKKCLIQSFNTIDHFEAVVQDASVDAFRLK